MTASPNLDPVDILLNNIVRSGRVAQTWKGRGPTEKFWADLWPREVWRRAAAHSNAVANHMRNLDQPPTDALHALREILNCDDMSLGQDAAAMIVEQR